MSAANVKEKLRLFNPCPRLCEKVHSNSRILVCFGVPLLPPSAILLGTAFGSRTDLGLFHIFGLLLTCISLVCIGIAIMICTWEKCRRRKRLKLKQVDAEKQEEVNDEQQVKERRPNGKIPTGSKSRLNSILNETNHTGKKGKGRKDKQKRHTNKTKLTPVKEEDRIRSEESEFGSSIPLHRKTHRRSKSDGKTKYMTERKKPPVKLMPDHDYDFGQLFGPRRYLRKKDSLVNKDRFVDYDSDSSVAPAKRIHRRTKSESRQQFEAALNKIPISNKAKHPLYKKNNVQGHLARHQALTSVMGDDERFAWSVQQSRRRSKSVSDCGDSDKDSQTTYSDFSFDIDTPREDKPKYNRNAPIAWKTQKEKGGSAERKNRTETTVMPILISVSHQRTGVGRSISQFPDVT